MKLILCAAAMLFMFVAPIQTHSQSLKKFEKKAKKTFKKEAYGMALYYSQAILKISSNHKDAIYWAKQSSDKLQLNQNPSGFITKLPVAINQPVTTKTISENEIKTDSQFPNPFTLIVKTFNAVDSTALNGTYIGLTNDGYGKGEFVQNNDFENTAFFEIQEGDFFTVTGTKNSFLASSSTLSTDDSPCPDTIYRRLYLSPSWGLPLTLYFDYKKPGATLPSDTVTNLTYEQAWIEYLYRIDDYIKGNTIGTTAAAKAKAQSEVGLFFAHYIDANYHQLKSLCELLESYLNAGKKITLKLEGYANPSEMNENNYALIKRRLNSVENYFSFHKHGMLKQYQTTGQLTIKRHFPEMGNKKENDFIHTENQSIYFPKNAMRQKVVVSLGDIFNY